MSAEQNEQNLSVGRERFASRLGFILMAAGCAIGLGNVWRFPFIAGQHGGGLFVALYLVFLAILGFPVLLFELALGRAGRSSFPGAFRNLQNRETKFRWDIPAYVLFAGNLVLLMFYTVVTGWLISYAFKFFRKSFRTMSPVEFQNYFGTFLGNPWEQIMFMLIAILITVGITIGGVRKVMEKVTKVMMLGLFALLLILVIRAVTLSGAGEGLNFFLMPNTKGFLDGSLLATVQAAMAHAFFTLSLGIGSIAIFGSYTSKEHSLPKEGLMIIILDTAVAICSGLIIFPACFSFGIQPNAGPSLIFITLPNVFRQMAGGELWGIIFFIFMAIAALSTLIAVFENLVAFGMDEFHWKRWTSCLFFGVLLAIFSVPCVLGFNVWSSWQPLGKGSCVLDLEDFIVSDNLLLLGGLYLSIFCMWGKGWGMEGFFKEVNTGNGLKLSRCFAGYMRWGVPAIIFAIWLIGLLGKFGVITRI